MAIKFQYNKTSLNELNKQLKTRTRALPTLKSKESALRLEVKKAKQRSERLVEQLEAELKSYEYMARLWNEFEPGLISVTDVKLKTVKIAGVPVPALEGHQPLHQAHVVCRRRADTEKPCTAGH